MAALIWKKDSKGKIIGRCDARCYNSKKPECDCICRGRNHGKGLPEATGLTFQLFEIYEEEEGVQVAACIKNLSLFLPANKKPS